MNRHVLSRFCSQPRNREGWRRPTNALLAGAFAGLMGLGGTMSACDDGGGEDMLSSNPDMAARADDLAAPAAADLAGSYNIVVSTTPITFDQFTATCRARGGLVQTTAICAGNNSCKGLSYLDGTLTEHSCKAMNACGPGMSCVDLPADSGKTGKEIYENGTCAPTCHAQFSPKYDPSFFYNWVRPGTVTLDAAKDRFLTGSKTRLESIIGFGVQGVNDDGTAYHTMPASFELYSLAEIDRVIDYIRTLPVVTDYYGFPWPDADGGTP